MSNGNVFRCWICGRASIDEAEIRKCVNYGILTPAFAIGDMVTYMSVDDKRTPREKNKRGFIVEILFPMPTYANEEIGGASPGHDYAVSYIVKHDECTRFDARYLNGKTSSILRTALEMSIVREAHMYRTFDEVCQKNGITLGVLSLRGNPLPRQICATTWEQYKTNVIERNPTLKETVECISTRLVNHGSSL